jgi:SAM-dependent methyltransferase
VSRDDPWYRSAFGEDYTARYAHRDAGEAAQAVALLTSQPEFAVAGLPILDLCCGAGRHLRELRSTTQQAFGGDLSAPLLRQAIQQECPIVQLDMRNLPFQCGSLGVVANFFTAFGYFEEDWENVFVIGEVSRVLRREGLFFLDFLNAHWVRASLAAREQDADEISFDRLGRRWRSRRALTTTGRVEKVSICLDMPDAPPVRESVRLFDKNDLAEAISQQGMEPLRFFGDYFGGAFCEKTSPRLIIVAQK